VKGRIVLLGPPASGKGTQAEMIKEKYHFSSASPGAILREEMKAGTALGLEADKLTSQGKLVPDEIANELVKRWLAKQDRAFVFDGYPRSMGQAKGLNDILAERGTPLDVVLSLEADMATTRDRVSRRMMCSQCGRIVSVGMHVTSADAVCPACGGELAKRRDDTPETFDLRMKEYEEKTEPLISYYTDLGLLRAVDGTRTPELVFQSIEAILEAE
jgi:adenylate kinase